MKIILVGPPTVGKTLSINRLFGASGSRTIETYQPTIGNVACPLKLDISEKETLDVILWDTAGAENLRGACDQAYSGADGVLVFTSRNLKSDEVRVSDVRNVSPDVIVHYLTHRDIYPMRPGAVESKFTPLGGDSLMDPLKNMVRAILEKRALKNRQAVASGTGAGLTREVWLARWMDKVEMCENYEKAVESIKARAPVMRVGERDLYVRTIDERLHLYETIEEWLKCVPEDKCGFTVATLHS